MSPRDPAGWDSRYEEKPLLWSEGPNRFVAEDLVGLSPGTALDVACGEGRNAVWLAGQGWDVTGVDFSAVALGRAEAMASRAGVEAKWINADVTTWEPPGPFDLVLVAYVHFSAPDRMELMRRATGWVAPGGRLYLVGHDRSTAGISGPPDPDLLWDPESATSAAAPLEVVFAEGRKRETGEGAEALDTVLMAVKPEGRPRSRPS